MAATTKTADVRPEAAAGSGSFWTSWRILLLLMALALVIRVLMVLTRPLIQFDESAYVSMAQNLAAGLGPLDMSGESATYFSPLLPLFITSFGFILRDHVLSGYAVNVIFGTLTLFPMYLLGKEFAGQRAGLMAAALLAVWPLFVDFSTRIYSETLFVFFLLMAIVFGRHMLRGCRVPCSTLAGMTLGLAYLANPAAIFYVTAFVLLAVIVAFHKGVWSQMAKAVGIFLLVFMLFALPYILFLHHELGSWTYTGKDVDVNAYTASQNLKYQTLEWDQDVMQLVEGGREVKLDRLEDKDDPLTVFLKEPAGSMKVMVRQAYDFYTDVLRDVIPLWLLPLVGLGLFAAGWNRSRALAVGYMLLMMTPALLILTVYVHPRFFMAYVPLVMVWVAEGWLRLEAWGRDTVELSLAPGRRQRWRKLVPWVIGALVLLPLILFSTATVVRQNYALEYREAGEWIRADSGGGQRVMNRESMSAFYAGSTPVNFPYADYEATTAYARYKDVDYMVISAEAIETYRPLLSGLLEDDASNYPDWELVQRLRPGTDQETLIFRLRK